MRFSYVLATFDETRMCSKKPKVMHQVLDKPMIGHVVSNLQNANVQHITLVVGQQSDLLKDYLKDTVSYISQDDDLTPFSEEGKTLVMRGDCPLVPSGVMESLFEACEDLSVLVDGQDHLTGIYCIDNHLLSKDLWNTPVEELVKAFNEEGKVVHTIVDDNPQETLCIQDRKMLADATRSLQLKINDYWLEHGVTILDPTSTYISTDTVIDEDVTIYPQVVCEGKNHIGANSIIHSGTYLKNSTIGEQTTILSSRITDSKVGNSVTIGPNSHLRNQCDVGDMVRIGNFVELKNTSFGYNTKCAHLTYVGDATVGDKVNFGCGVVTVNYDGKNKFRTTIDDGAFIGSNVNLIAPVHIGKNALLAAGSTINFDVEDGDMGIARSRQEIKKGFGQKYKNK